MGKAPVVEPSKPAPRRQRHDDRNTKSGRSRPPARDGKRTYDRRSGTGRGREIKKGGGGGRNWGSDKNIAKKNVGAVDEKTLEKKEKEDSETPEVEEKVETAAEENKEDIKEEEPEDNTMSYEEYLKSKAKPEEGILAPVQKKELVNEFEGKATHKVKNDESGDEAEISKKTTKVKKEKKESKAPVVPSFRVGEPNKRGERGGRVNRGQERR